MGLVATQVLPQLTNSGLVTGVSQGISTFVFHKTGGCSSNPTTAITINGKPNILINGPSALCPGSTSQLHPTSGGTWSSSNSTVASVTNSGIVTAISSGSAKFLFTESSTGCKSDSSSNIIVYQVPFVTLTGPANICPGASSSVSPSTGGIWSSSNTSVATINNSGLISALSPGVTNFTFTHSATGCMSNTSLALNVYSKPAINLATDMICVGDTMRLSASHSGHWTAVNPSIATITPSGLVTALEQGVAKFTMTGTATGCVSNPSAPLIVNGRPNPSISGATEICVGSTTTLSPSSGGTWSSTRPDIASVSNAGVVTALEEGLAHFIFTDTDKGCASDSSAGIFVTPGISVSIAGPSVICLGYQTQLMPDYGGTWSSSNLHVADIRNGGMVVGIGPGKVTFSFVESGTGCMGSLSADAITVQSCIDPDFNVTKVELPVVGNVSTNDEVPTGTTYSNSTILEEKPTGSLYSLNVQSSGHYQFLANKIGVYRFRVPVCVPPYNQSCLTSNLDITVVDTITINASAVNNVDIATAYSGDMNALGNAITLKTLINDKCVLGATCNIDPLSVNVLTNPVHGNCVVNADGTITYTPAIGHSGLDTLIYQACIEGEPSTCMKATQVIITNTANAVNSTVAADDFFATNKGIALFGNVKDNDSDPEGDEQTVQQQGSVAAPMIIPQGSYYISSNGDFYFAPLPSFSGPLDIVYTICDDATRSACAKATAHILVLNDLSIKIKVYLEAALIENNNEKSSTGRPLMRDNLRENPFTGENNIPVADPYRYPSSNVDVTGAFEFNLPPGATNLYDIITDSALVFSTTGENAIVDWVFVELRHKDDSTQVIAARSGLLQRDGDVVDLDGYSPLAFEGVNVDSFYIVVRHRLHLGVMSNKVASKYAFDFTAANANIFDFGTRLNNGYDYTGLAQNKEVKTGYQAMWAGDFNADGKIKFTNPDDDINYLFYDVFIHPENLLGNANFNYAYGYYQGDINMNGKIKFDNPNDDKNFLYAQLLFYPLNTSYLSNFNYMIEQIP